MLQSFSEIVKLREFTMNELYFCLNWFTDCFTTLFDYELIWFCLFKKERERNHAEILRNLLCVECTDLGTIHSFIHFIFNVPGSVLGTEVQKGVLSCKRVHCSAV